MTASYQSIQVAAFALLGLSHVACGQGTRGAGATLQVGDVVYRARVRTIADSVVVVGHGPVGRQALQAAVTVTNVGPRAVMLDQWPGCFFTTLELSPTATNGRGPRRDLRAPAWDEERWRAELQRAAGVIVECDFAVAPGRLELRPGASLTFERGASRPLVRDVLGDSLPAGTYRAALRIRPHTAPRNARPTLRVAAGEAVLR